MVLHLGWFCKLGVAEGIQGALPVHPHSWNTKQVCSVCCFKILLLHTVVPKIGLENANVSR